MKKVITITLFLLLTSCHQDDYLIVEAPPGADGLPGESCTITETNNQKWINCPGFEPVILDGDSEASQEIEMCSIDAGSNGNIIYCGDVNVAYKGLGKSCTVEDTPNGLVMYCSNGKGYVYNGKDGKDGINGKDGADGAKGKDGKNGLNGKDGRDGLDGTNGADGKDGINGTSCTIKDHPEGVAITCSGITKVLYDGKNGKCTNCCKKLTCEIYKSGNHTVWFADSKYLKNDYVFIPYGIWEQDTTGLVRVTGYVISQSDSEKVWHLDVFFKNMTRIPPPGSPKHPKGNDTSKWYYYKDFSGVMVGEGDFEGAVLEIIPRGPVMQVGHGASIHNTKFGAASWFSFKVKSQPHHGPKLKDGVGDFNWTFDCY